MECVGGQLGSAVDGSRALHFRTSGIEHQRDDTSSEQKRQILVSSHFFDLRHVGMRLFYSLYAHREWRERGGGKGVEQG